MNVDSKCVKLLQNRKSGLENLAESGHEAKPDNPCGSECSEPGAICQPC